MCFFKKDFQQPEFELNVRKIVTFFSIRGSSKGWPKIEKNDDSISVVAKFG